MPTRRPRPWAAFLADFAVLVAFVAIGRRSHHLHSPVTHLLGVLWPFAVGLVAGWLVTRLERAPLAWGRVAVAWIVTVALGMTLRLTLQDHAFMVGFTIVTTLFVGACMFGWRLVYLAVVRRRGRTR